MPGDASSAAFFLCAAAMIPQSEVTARGMLLNETRTGFLKVLERMGVIMDIREKGGEPEPWGSVTVRFFRQHGGQKRSGRRDPRLDRRDPHPGPGRHPGLRHHDLSRRWVNSD